ncbi:substrate-binding domain-containing protein, partial [Treponema pallidum]
MKGTGMCVALLLCALGAGACKRSEKPTIGVVVYQYDNTLVARLRHILSTVGKKHARILIVDSQASQSIQNKHIDQFIARGVHGLAVNLVDHRAARTVIEKAQQAR